MSTETQSIAAADDGAVRAEPAAAQPDAVPVPAIRSDGQKLLDRHLAIFNRLLAVHRRFLEVRGSIVATPAPSTGAEKPPSPIERPMPLFPGLAMIADADETALKAIEADLDELASLL